MQARHPGAPLISFPILFLLSSVPLSCPPLQQMSHQENNDSEAEHPHLSLKILLVDSPYQAGPQEQKTVELEKFPKIVSHRFPSWRSLGNILVVDKDDQRSVPADSVEVLGWIEVRRKKDGTRCGLL